MCVDIAVEIFADMGTVNTGLPPIRENILPSRLFLTYKISKNFPYEPPFAEPEPHENVLIFEFCPK
jgi:hypothetical protein